MAQLLPLAKAPWKVEQGLEPVLKGWLTSERVRPCFAAERDYAAEASATAPLPEALHPSLVRALASRGITTLYSHQAKAFEIAQRRKPFVVATPTASGQSL